MKKQIDSQALDTSEQIIKDNPKLGHPENGIDIVFQNIAYSVRVPDDTVKTKIPCKRKYKQKEILKGISGIFKARQTTAIMGASGAGKTTLLNILACRINSTSDNSKLYANNFEYQYSNFGDFANYVMQADILMQTLTVRETLDFAATLKINKSQQQIKPIMNEIVTNLKLEKCLDTMVGGVVLKGVSGGQRKRTSIAFELISDPQVLFLDEPTSGLDSLTSYIIISYLKKLAKNKNKTIIMTIHQPNSETYELFDNLTLLLEGRIIYQAKASQVREYFQANFRLTCSNYVNPSDFVMSKIHFEDEKNRGRYPEYFAAYEKNQKSQIQRMIKNKGSSEVEFRDIEVGFCTTLTALVKRNALNSIRNPLLIKAKFFQTIFMALFVGGIFFGIGDKDMTQPQYFRPLTGFLFFLSINNLMGSLTPITLSFPLERVVFFKEQDSKMYSTPLYFLARNIIQIPEMIIMPMVFALINYWMVGLSSTAEQFFIHYLVMFLMFYNGASLGLLLGSVIFDAKSVSTLVPIIVMPFILFSGFFKNREDLPVWISWIEYISPIKYGFIGFVENQVAYRDSLINLLNFDLEKWPAIFILLGLGTGFRLLSLFFLWFLRTKNQ